MIVGAIVVVPAIATTVWLLAQLGLGDPELRLLHAIRVTAIFAGTAALLTAGGVGRLAAQVSVDTLPATGSPARHEEAASRRRPLVIAGRTFAAAGAGLTIIAVLPHAAVPEGVLGWIAIALAGAGTGFLCGAAIGAVCGGTATLDVIALARWPTDVLRQLLEPEDLAAVRSRPRKRRITFPFIFGPKDDAGPATAGAASVASVPPAPEGAPASERETEPAPPITPDPAPAPPAPPAAVAPAPEQGER